MSGAVDFAISPVIRGWVKTEGSHLGKIEVWRENKLVAEAELGSIRTDIVDIGLHYDFRCVVLGGYSLEELATQRMKVIWRNEDKAVSLRIWEPILVAGHIAGMPDKKLERMIGSMKIEDIQRLMNTAKKFLGNHCTQTITDGLVPSYGFISEDGVATVGAGGHYFIFKGNNKLINIYKRADASDAILKGWAEIIDKRSAWCSQHKIGYLQVFIPEKSSVTPQLAPYSISGPSATWNGVLSQAKKNPQTLDCYELLDSLFSPESAFRKQDSHLSTYGAMHVVISIVERITGHRISCRKIKSQLHKLPGDLAKRFNGLPTALIEPLEVLIELEIDGAIPHSPQLIESFNPTEGHTGIRRVWRNDSSLFQQRVVCFGNSFFERGGTSASLSWWLARLFREFHFIWSANLDYDYVIDVSGDFVICQTIERFLEQVPQK